MSHLVLPKEIESKFRLITVAAQRAKQLQNGAKPKVEVKSRKPTRVAMHEVLANAISWEMREEGALEAEAAAAAAAEGEAETQA